ncbi:MAG TPA: DNA recombination protein RmuC [Candidatus Acidoferrales bacterium]|nr:DNA recombination protein RmuC [Candidatus Acidoferrales bacterium]
MSPVVWLIAVVVAVAILAAIVWSGSRRSETQLSAVRQEMQNSLAAQAQAISAQMNHLMQSVTQNLGQVRQELQTGVASTGQLATEAQRDVAQRLQSSTEVLLQMNRKIGEMHQTSQDLSKATQTLQSVLGGAKTRGTLGEVALDRLLEDALPQSAYATQYRFGSTGAVVDAIVRSGDRILSIDSKFPLEAYRRLVELGDDARREFSTVVRKHADSIGEKYILPNENTFDYALMFVPSEGVYYELLMTQDSKYGRLDEYCRSKRVFPVSPNTFYACLNAVAISLQGQKIEENARHLLAGMAGLKKQLESFAEVYEKLGTHLRHAQQCYEDADSRLGRTRNSLEQMSQGVLPEADVNMLEAAARRE